MFLVLLLLLYFLVNYSLEKEVQRNVFEKKFFFWLFLMSSKKVMMIN